MTKTFLNTQFRIIAGVGFFAHGVTFLRLRVPRKRGLGDCPRLVHAIGFGFSDGIVRTKGSFIGFRVSASMERGFDDMRWPMRHHSGPSRRHYDGITAACERLGSFRGCSRYGRSISSAFA